MGGGKYRVWRRPFESLVRRIVLIAALVSGALPAAAQDDLTPAFLAAGRALLPDRLRWP